MKLTYVYTKLWCTYKSGTPSPWKKKEILFFPAIGKRMEDYVLTKVSHVENNKDNKMSFICEI